MHKDKKVWIVEEREEFHQSTHHISFFLLYFAFP
jgi:hypothetical protein